MSWKDNTEPLGSSWKAGAGDYISFIPDTSYVPKEPKKNSSLNKLEAAPKKSGFLFDVFGKDAYNEFKSTHQDTPNFLKPIGFALESVNRIPLTNRLLNQSAEFLGAKRINADGSELKTLSTGNKLADGLTDVGANLLGSAMAGPSGGANLLNATDNIAKLAGGKVANLTKNKLLAAAARGSVDAAGSVGLEDLSKGKLKELPKEVAINALGGGVLLGGGQATKELTSKLSPKLGKLLPDLTEGLYDVKTKDLLGDLVTTNSKVTQIGKPLDEVLNPKKLFNKDLVKTELNSPIKAKNPLNAESNINIGNAVWKNKDFDQPVNVLGDLGEINGRRYAKIEGSNTGVPLDEIEFSSKQKESKFKTNTMRKAEILKGEEVQKTIDNIKAMYEVKPNEQSVARATKELEINPQGVINRIRLSKALNSAEDATAAGLITNQLRLEADTTGDFAKLKEWLETVQPKVTNTAQGLQALSTWKKLTPEGALTKAQQVVGQVNREGKKLYGENFTPTELTADEMKFINDTMKKVEAMADGRDKDIAFAKVKNVIAEKIPPTLRDKVNAIRNISLLLNPKTMTRNVVGNLLTGAGDSVSNTLSATLLRPLDNFMARTTGVKTTALPSLGVQAKGFGKGVKETLSDSVGGLKVSELKGKSVKEQAKLIIDGISNPIKTDTISNNKFEVRQTSSFKSKPMKILENALGTSLAIGDKPFSQAYYDDVINQLKKANKIDVISEDMKKIAEKVAQERTYQDTNTITDLAMGIKNLPQRIQDHPRLKEAIQIFVDSIFPYTKTPTAILKRGLEFSPEGIIEGVAKLGVASRNGNLTPELQREILDRISRGITGTGLIAGGVALANNNLLTGAANKDKDVADFESQIGKQPFSVKLGDKNYSYSQYQPLSMALGVGAQIAQNKGKGIDAVTTLANAGSNALEYYSDQPMLQSIQRLAGSANSSKGIGQRIIDASLELPKQFVPTLGKQISQVKDDTQRSTYSPNYLEGQLTNPIKAKIPGVSKTLEPKVDTLGNEVKQFQGNNSLFNIFLNPGYTTTEKATPVQKLILDTYNETGDKTIFPRVADKSITYKNNKYDLTSKEFTEFQKYIGTQTNKMMNDDLTKLQLMSPEDRAKQLQKNISRVYDEGKKKILEKRGVKIEK